MLQYGAQADRQEGVTRTVSALDWLEALPVTATTVREAALIEAELLNQGTPINAVDLLIAGVVREAGGTLVTRDSDFEHIQELTVEAYDCVYRRDRPILSLSTAAVDLTIVSEGIETLLGRTSRFRPSQGSRC